jgi:hypothetical protein
MMPWWKALAFGLVGLVIVALSVGLLGRALGMTGEELADWGDVIIAVPILTAGLIALHLHRRGGGR